MEFSEFYSERMLKLEIVAHTHTHTRPFNTAIPQRSTMSTDKFEDLILHCFVFFLFTSLFMLMWDRLNLKRNRNTGTRFVLFLFRFLCVFLLWLLLFNMVKWAKLLVSTLYMNEYCVMHLFHVRIDNRLRSTRSQTRTMRERHPVPKRCTVINRSYKIQGSHRNNNNDENGN